MLTVVTNGSSDSPAQKMCLTGPDTDAITRVCAHDRHVYTACVDGVVRQYTV